MADRTAIRRPADDNARGAHDINLTLTLDDTGAIHVYGNPIVLDQFAALAELVSALERNYRAALYAGLSPEFYGTAAPTRRSGSPTSAALGSP